MEKLKSIRKAKFRYIIEKVPKTEQCMIFNNLTEFELNHFRPLIIQKFNNFQKISNLGK